MDCKLRAKNCGGCPMLAAPARPGQTRPRILPAASDPAAARAGAQPQTGLPQRS